MGKLMIALKSIAYTLMDKISFIASIIRNNVEIIVVNLSMKR